MLMKHSVKENVSLGLIDFRNNRKSKNYMRNIKQIYTHKIYIKHKECNCFLRMKLSVMEYSGSAQIKEVDYKTISKIALCFDSLCKPIKPFHRYVINTGKNTFLFILVCLVCCYCCCVVVFGVTIKYKSNNL